MQFIPLDQCTLLRNPQLHQMYPTNILKALYQNSRFPQQNKGNNIYNDHIESKGNNDVILDQSRKHILLEGEEECMGGENPLPQCAFCTMLLLGVFPLPCTPPPLPAELVFYSGRVLAKIIKFGQYSFNGQLQNTTRNAKSRL